MGALARVGQALVALAGLAVLVGAITAAALLT